MGRENGRCRLSWRLTKLCKTTGPPSYPPKLRVTLYHTKSL
jgi:hypothetical protein